MVTKSSGENQKVITIMILIIAFEIVYLIGFYMPNKVVYGNSEEEIAGIKSAVLNGSDRILNDLA